MRKMKCPKCRSEHISQERRIDGDAVCMDCHHRGKPEEFHRQTYFDQISASPEALAERVVYIVTDKYSDGNEWMSAIVNGFWLTRREAVDATIEYLKQEV